MSGSVRRLLRKLVRNRRSSSATSAPSTSAPSTSTAARPRPVAARPKITPGDGTTGCAVCGSTNLLVEPIAVRADQRPLTAVCCRSCRYVRIPENYREYEAAESADDLGGGLGPRMGTWDTPGREYKMAKLAVDVLGRDDVSVLIYGIGRSIDNHHVARIDKVSRVAIGDLVKARNDAEFIDISKPAVVPDEKFDIVVASEVLEHFPDPHENFKNLFSYVKRNGLIVCGTNIRDNISLQKVTYIRYSGHISYWSPRSLRVIARAHGMIVDYRLPLNVIGRGGPRKRYIFFSRSKTVMERLTDWFGSHVYAPSEDPHAGLHEQPTLIPKSPDDVPLGR